MLSLSPTPDRNERRQESELNAQKPITTKPESEEMLQETSKVLTELKPPPRTSETVVNGHQVRNSYSSINQEAAVVERVVRESGLDHGISSDQLMNDLTLAKNYVVDSGRKEVEASSLREPAHWEQGLKSALTEAQAISRGIPLSEITPIAESRQMATRMSNASPEAAKIAMAEGIQIPEAMQISLVHAIKESQDRLVHGQRTAHPAPIQRETLQSTFDRIRRFAAEGVTSESLVVNNPRIDQAAAYSLSA